LFPGEPGADLSVLIKTLCDDEDAEWVLEKHGRVTRVYQQLEKVVGSYEERRVVPPLRESESTSRFYVFVVAASPGDSASAAERRRRFALHHDLLKLLRSIDPTLFEVLCGKVLEEIGCNAIHVTQASQDYGVDFFGRMPLAKVPDEITHEISATVRVLGALSILLFGQAKRYNAHNRVDDGEIKELEATWGDVERARTDGELSDDLEAGLKHVNWRTADPILLVFVTTSSYTRRALEFAKRKGVITLDGDQFSQLLLDLAIGVRLEPDGQWAATAETVEAAGSDT
jgi:restriction endonuclease Mrr